MEIASYSKRSDLDAAEDAWEHLSEQELHFVPSFKSLRHHLQGDDAKFRIMVATENSQTIAIACFIYWRTTKRYEIASRQLFRLPVTELSMFGSCVLGKPSEDVIREFFRILVRESDFDIINLGEIFIDSPLHRAVTSLGNGTMAWRVSRTERVWWLLRLSATFDEYLSSLPESTRTHLIRDFKKCEKALPELRIMLHPEDVETFLQVAEKISRLTYQWKIGYGTCNDEATRNRLTQSAQNGMLRCYLLFLDGTPAAFGWGDLCHGSFAFQQTGYDPQFRKLSPGSALILRMIRDMIENTNCKVFDFKWGNDFGYKARFGNINLACMTMNVARMYRPYSFLIMLLDHGLNMTKLLVGSVVEHPLIKQRLRRLLRRLGMRTF